MAPRTKLLLESAREMESLWQMLIEILEDADDIYIPPMILRKMLIKLFARVRCAYLPPRWSKKGCGSSMLCFVSVYNRFATLLYVVQNQKEIGKKILGQAKIESLGKGTDTIRN